MVYIGLVIATLVCAYQVMRAERLMMATIWLAFSSAIVALLLYILGAYEVAVIELSVGAGLVTVLFVFAFSIIGEATIDPTTLVPRVLVWVTILAVSFALGSLTLPLTGLHASSGELPFAVILWQQRWPDVLAQIALIFAGVLGVVGLLSEETARGEAGSIASQIETVIPPEMDLEPTFNGFHPEPERAGEPEEAKA
jgi:uncharacterized MnhB-related membrane protein